MADTIQPTPRSNKLLGLLADALGGVYDYAQRPDPTMPMGLANPVLGLLSNALPLKAGANVLDDLSYGRAPLRGTGMTTRLTPDATELAMAAAPFPKTSGKAALAALGAVDTGASGLGKAAIVWHGSPHRFNAFDASKIGTGEGAQAYGHGLYLAESPDVARSYQRNLASTLSVDGKPIFQNGRIVNSTGNEMVDDLLLLHSGDTKSASRDMLTQLRDLRERFASQPKATAPAMLGVEDKIIKQAQGELAALRAVRNQSNYAVDGSLYKVDLPDNMIARMLDWDKPLSQQAGMVPRVFDNNWQHSLYRKRGNRDVGDFTGADLVNAFGSDSHSRALFAEDLRRAGIPGIRYLDGGSRGAGAGTSNFVVFPGEENALTILERNGRGLLD